MEQNRRKLLIFRQIPLYPAVTPVSSFESIDVAKKSFQMEADYTVGDKSITFTHKSALVKASFSNVPSFATGLKVTEGETVVATISNVESTDGNTVDFFVPLTPNGSKKYTFSLMENSNVVKSAAKTIELTAGHYYTTPTIAVSIVTVGVIDYIYESGPGNWGLSTGWNLYYNDGSDHSVEMKNLGTTTTKQIPGKWSEAKTFHLFYLPVPADINKFKVFWTNGTNTDWYGSDNENMNLRKAFVYEWSSSKDAYYSE